MEMQQLIREGDVFVAINFFPSGQVIKCLYIFVVWQIGACEKWVCYMCSGKSQGLITPRKDWSAGLQELFMNDKEQDFVRSFFMYSVQSLFTL